VTKAYYEIPMIEYIKIRSPSRSPKVRIAGEASISVSKMICNGGE
jgi:hypothetical protein